MYNCVCVYVWLAFLSLRLEPNKYNNIATFAVIAPLLHFLRYITLSLCVRVRVCFFVAFLSSLSTLQPCRVYIIPDLTRCKANIHTLNNRYRAYIKCECGCFCVARSLQYGMFSVFSFFLNLLKRSERR